MMKKDQARLGLGRKKQGQAGCGVYSGWIHAAGAGARLTDTERDKWGQY